MRYFWYGPARVSLLSLGLALGIPGLSVAEPLVEPLPLSAEPAAPEVPAFTPNLEIPPVAAPLAPVATKEIAPRESVPATVLGFERAPEPAAQRTTVATRLEDLVQRQVSLVAQARAAVEDTERRQVPRNTSIFDRGIVPTPPLVVPTNPDQVRLTRAQPISLQEALELAEVNSKELERARIAVRRARGEREEALAGFAPTVGVTGQYSFSDSADIRQGNIARLPGLGDSPTLTQPLSGAVQLSYNVYTSGLVEALVGASDKRLRAAEADLKRIRQGILLQVINAYIDLQQADETVRIREASVAAREKSLADTQALERAGVGTKFDVLQAEVQLSNARQQLLSDRNNQQVRQRALAQLLQFAPTVNLTAADKIVPREDWQLPLEETIVQAFRNRAELDVQRQLAESFVDRAKAELARLGPQVTLTSSLDARDNLSNVGGISLGYTLGARVSWQLLDGGVAAARVKQFEADRDTAVNRFEDLLSQIRLEVESSYSTLLSGRERIQTADKAVASASEALRLARLRLTAGVGTQLEVIRAEEDLTQAEVNRSNAIFDFNRARATLDRAVDGL